MHNNEFYRRITAFCRFAEGTLTVFFWLLLIYGLDDPCLAGLTVVSAVIHECGHAAVLGWIGKGGSGAFGRLSGPRIGVSSLLSYNEDLAVLLGGAVTNFALAAASLPFLGLLEGYVGLFALFNLVTGVSSLLPVRGRDGYGVAEVILERRGSATGLRVLAGVSVVLTFCTCVLSLYLMERVGEGFWSFGVFFFSLLSEVFLEVKK